MPRSTMSSAAAALKHTTAASAAPVRIRRMSSLFLRVLVAQPLAHEPLLDQLRDLIAVLVHHHHVRISLDADIGQIDQIEAAARGLERLAIVDAVLPDVLPARMVLGVVADDYGDRRALDRSDLALVAADRRLHRDQRP